MQRSCSKRNGGSIKSSWFPWKVSICSGMSGEIEKCRVGFAPAFEQPNRAIRGANFEIARTPLALYRHFVSFNGNFVTQVLCVNDRLYYI